MTTDDFTTAAHAEAIRAWTTPQFDGGNVIGMLGQHMAEWARTYLAEREVSDAEVLAALNADYALRYGGRNIPADSLDPYGDEHVAIMRAALAAAREARHDVP